MESLEIEVLLKNSDHKQVFFSIFHNYSLYDFNFQKKKLSAVAQFMGSGIELKEKKYRLRKFKDAFTGTS